MLTSFQPRGIYSAQWIPVDAAGKIDRAALAEHIAFERRQGIDGVLALGSTGEFPFFSLEERKQALEIVREIAAPLPVMANITDIRPKAAIELGRVAKSLGMPAVALMPPFFYPVSQADMLAYFLHVADAVQLPVMLYNFPELTGKKIELETIAAFADRAPMAAIKQSGGEFDYHRQLIPLGREKNFVVMSGADLRLPEVFKLGAAGCIGGLVNIVPEVMVALHRICTGAQPGDFSAAQRCMTDIGGVIDQLTFPVNVAAGLEARGFRPGTPKWVIAPESHVTYTKMIAALRPIFARHRLEMPGAAAA